MKEKLFAMKKRIFLTVISCVGMLLVAVGATLRPLYFLAWIGGSLTLGSMYLYYKELEREGNVFFFKLVNRG